MLLAGDTKICAPQPLPTQPQPSKKCELYCINPPPTGCPLYNKLSDMDKLRLQAFAVEHLLTEKGLKPPKLAVLEAAIVELVPGQAHGGVRGGGRGFPLPR